MRLILHYISGMLGYMLILFPFYCIGRYIYLRRTGNKSDVLQELVLGSFVLYMIGLSSQTISPRWYMGIYSDTGQFYFDIYAGIDLSRVNLIPFKTISSQLFGANPSVDDWNSVSLLNLMTNVFLFAPIGLFFPLLWTKWNSIKNVFFVGLMTTSLVEVIQLFIGRSVDIDDIILNTIGVFIGYGFFICASKFKLFQSISTNLKTN